MCDIQESERQPTRQTNGETSSTQENERRVK